MVIVIRRRFRLEVLFYMIVFIIQLFFVGVDELQWNLYAVNDSYPTSLLNENNPKSDNLVELSESNIHIFGDDFNNSPLGYNPSLWITYFTNDLDFQWRNNNSLILETGTQRFAGLYSNLQLGPCTCVIPKSTPIAVSANGLIAQFDIDYSAGLCYFGIGWTDSSPECGNLRMSRNGVFIDYYDRQLFLVTCNNGSRSVTTIAFDFKTSIQTFRLVWTESVVYLEIEGCLQCCLTTTIPNVILPFHLTVSGADSNCGVDQLIIESVDIYTYGVPSYTKGPRILLLWPRNGSHVLVNDTINFRLYGSDGFLTFSWDNGTTSLIREPWQILVPKNPGQHILKILVWNITGGWIVQYYCFTVELQPDSLTGMELIPPPTLDGIVDNQEQNNAYRNAIPLIQEDNTILLVDMFVGFYNDSIYLGLDAPIKAGLSTRIDLYIDRDGDKIWNGNNQSETSDIRISVAPPKADQEMNGLWNAQGERLLDSQYSSINYTSSTMNEYVMAEFMIPIQMLVTDITENVGIAITIIDGGTESYFPFDTEQESLNRFVAIEIIQVPQNLDLNLIFILIGISALVLTTAFIVKFPNRKAISISTSLPEEDLERVRTLLISYPRISIERLKEMSGICDTDFDEALRILMDSRLVDVEISSSGELIRNSSHNSS